jgi:predicted dehydrogenase
MFYSLRVRHDELAFKYDEYKSSLMKTISIGIVGAGSIATNMHIPVLKAMKSGRIAWITDIDAVNSRRVALSYGLKAVSLENGVGDLPGCDLVLLALPVPPREQYYNFYAETDTAIFAEKPLAVDSAEHLRLMTAFQPWQVSVGYQRRTYATSRLLKSFVESGVFGPLKAISIAEGGRTTRTQGWGGYQDQSVVAGGGIIKNLGCHSLDLAFWISGANGYSIVNRHVEWDGDTDRAGSAKLRLHGMSHTAGSECDFKWGVSWLSEQPNTVELHFERVTIRSMSAPDTKVEIIDAHGKKLAEIDARATGGAITSIQAFYQQWSDVIDGVLEHRESVVSARSCFTHTKLMDELLEY